MNFIDSFIEIFESDDESHPSSKMPKIFDGKYFKIISKDGDNIKAQCMNCVNRSYSGNVHSTGNFYKHISKIHPDILNDVKTYTTTTLKELNQRTKIINHVPYSHLHLSKNVSFIKFVSKYFTIF